MRKKMLDNKINCHVTMWFAYWRTADFLVVAAELMRERISVIVFWQRTKMDLPSKAVQGGFLLAKSWNGELKRFSGGPRKEMSICDSSFTEMGVILQLCTLVPEVLLFLFQVYHLNSSIFSLKKEESPAVFSLHFQGWHFSPTAAWLEIHPAPFIFSISFAKLFPKST